MNNFMYRSAYLLLPFVSSTGTTISLGPNACKLSWRNWSRRRRGTVRNRSTAYLLRLKTNPARYRENACDVHKWPRFVDYIRFFKWLRESSMIYPIRQEEVLKLFLKHACQGNYSANLNLHRTPNRLYALCRSSWFRRICILNLAGNRTKLSKRNGGKIYKGILVKKETTE